MMTSSRLALAAIATSVLVLYLPTVQFEFINYDDPLYLDLNPGVMTGLTLAGLKEMWGSFSYGNWHPLTLMSHALDVHLFDLNPGPHHLMSMVFHLINSLLVFVFLHRWTGNLHAAWITALLWAIHPQNIDAVAWVSQRKTLLSAMFGLLALIRYLDFRKRPTAGNAAMVAALFLLGLFSKGVLVTLPLVMMITLDRIPLSPQAPAPTGNGRFLAPILLGLGGLFGLLVMIGQQTTGSVVTTLKFPLIARIGHALDNLVHYVTTIVFPFGLAIHYPPPDAPLHPVHAWVLAVVLGGGSLWAWRRRRTSPWLVAGWSWYLLLIAPLSGILATGQAIKTDRFAYLPSIGLLLIAGWLIARGIDRWPKARVGLGLVILLLGLRSADQIQVWRNNETVYRHALAVTPDSALIRNNLAVHYIATDRMSEAAVELVEALRQLSDDPHAWANLELVLSSPDGQRGLAHHLDEVAATRPDDPSYRLVRFMIALVQVREHEARRLWTDIMDDPDPQPDILSRAGQFLDLYEQRYGPLFGAPEP